MVVNIIYITLYNKIIFMCKQGQPKKKKNSVLYYSIDILLLK
jgi:hypothetical protein